MIVQQQLKYQTPQSACIAVRDNVTRRAASSLSANAPADNNLRGAVATKAQALFPFDHPDIAKLKRYALLSWFFGKASTAAMTDAECRAFLWWSSECVDDEWITPEAATRIANAIVDKVGVAAGQQTLF
jgi:hypothetical protein